MVDRSQKADQPASSKQLLNALNKAAARLKEVERERHEPIAIVGLSCRFPGATNPTDFWRLLHDGVDAVRETPPDRWDIDAYYDPDPNAVGKMYTRSGGFLDTVDTFDPHFFGIPPREAVGMDPQHRLLLEVSWEALEMAGLPPESQTGVFIGITTQDYMQLMREVPQQQTDIYFATGNNLNAAAGRLSYTFGLTGPCIAIDTACSSSLVAVHLACQSLRLRECRQALAGGVNLILNPEAMVVMSRWGLLSPSGRCKSFAATADGMARGEGCGIVVLKRLSDAVADGDNVLALIRGSAVNQDGPSSGLTVPNGVSQEALIRQALAKARLQPADLDYVEGHGTGTSLGDPIEVNALGAVRGAGPPLLIGSVKSNIAHTEAAAGVAGLIKVVLALQHELIPPSLHAAELNPHIDWANLPIKVVREATPWPSSEKPRLAGVSSFGLSGTNAHIIVEQAPPSQAAANPVERPWHLLALSAKSEPALTELTRRYRAFLDAHPDTALADVCYTAASGRGHFAHRLSVIAATSEEMQAKLAAIADGDVQPNAGYGYAPDYQSAPQIAFLFTGQGSQYPGMGRELFATQPAFRRALNRCDEILRLYWEKSLLAVLDPPQGDRHSWLNQTAYTQPALFALEYALAELWKSWGIEPDVVMGHSVGEIVAACIAGVFSLEDGLKLTAARGRLMGALPPGGAMVAVMANQEVVQTALAAYGDAVSIAAVNGPQNVVISGQGEAVYAIAKQLEEQGVKTHKLTVSHAFHSALMEPMLAEFGQVAREIRYNSPRIALISNVTGKRAANEVMKPAYWVRHIRQPVRFADGVRTLRQENIPLFLEIGPKPTLLGMARTVIDEAGEQSEYPVMLPSLRSGRSDWQQLLTSLGQLYVHGVDVDWADVHKVYAQGKVVLPTYPFQRQRYWVESSPDRGNGVADAAQTAVTELLAQGAIDQLRRRLAGTGKFSAEETALLPKLLEALAAEYGSQSDAAIAKKSTLEWRPTPQFGLRPDYLTAPQQVAESLAAEVDGLLAAVDFGRHEEAGQYLETLCVDYVLTALADLGFRFEPGASWRTVQIAQQVGVIPNYHRLLERLLGMLAEEGILARQGQVWQVVRAPKERDVQQQVLAVTEQIGAWAQDELLLLTRCGEKLADVLRGAQEPLELLFPGGDGNLIAKLHREAPRTLVMNTLAQRALQAAIQQLPAGRGLRILEVGAGTGSATEWLLPHLPPQQTEHLFTDASAFLVAKARQTLGEYGFVQFQTLDIEQSPISQQISPHQYDIVVAANALYATRDLRAALAHVRQLLAPGGMLLLLEGTMGSRWVDLTFGLTEDWWRFDDDIRTDYPLLNPRQWQEALLASGFTEVAVAPPDESMSAQLKSIVCMARAGETATLPGRRWLLFSEQTEGARALAAALRGRGEEPILVSAGATYAQMDAGCFQIDPASAADQRQLHQALPPFDHVVYLWGLEDQALADSALDTPLHSKVALARTVQALLDIVGEPPKLWLVTQGAQALADDESAQASQSVLWGWGEEIVLEHPELQTVRVDLDPAIPVAGQAENLRAELMQPAGKKLESPTQIALRGGVRYVAQPAAAEEPILSAVSAQGNGQPSQGGQTQQIGAQLADADTNTQQRLLVTWLQETAAQIFGLADPNQVEPQSGPGFLGMDSLMVAELNGHIERELGVQVSWADLLTKSFEDIAATLSERLADRSSNGSDASSSLPVQTIDPLLTAKREAPHQKWIRSLNPHSEARMRLFCLPYGGGGASIYRGWHKALPAMVEVCPIQLPGREDRILEPPFDQLDALVSALVGVLQPYLDRPFALFGHSLGARLSFELAHALRTTYGLEPAHLFVAGYDAPKTIRPRESPIHLRPRDALLQRVRQLGMIPEALIDDEDLINRSLNTLRADARMIETLVYQPRPSLNCPITVLGGQEDTVTSRPNLALWREQTTGAFDMYMLPGGHDFIRQASGAIQALLSEKLAVIGRRWAV